MGTARLITWSYCLPFRKIIPRQSQNGHGTKREWRLFSGHPVSVSHMARPDGHVHMGGMDETLLLSGIGACDDPCKAETILRDRAAAAVVRLGMGL